MAQVSVEDQKFLELVKHGLSKGSDRCRNRASTRLLCTLVLATDLATAVGLYLLVN